LGNDVIYPTAAPVPACSGNGYEEPPPPAPPEPRIACRPVGEIDPLPDEQRWLIEELWAAFGVGIVGGMPKTGKTWFVTDLAVSVASATSALGRFAVPEAGPVLFFPAEDDPRGIRDRVAGLCSARELELGSLPLHIITHERLHLDEPADCAGLEELIERLHPKLLVLDPLVRLHGGDENYAGHVASILGYLRVLSRRFSMAIMVTHHISKRAHAHPGQALRGSSDLHAWGDSNAYLRREKDGTLTLTLEHRSAPAPDPIALRIASDAEGNVSLEFAEGRPHLPQSASDDATLSERVMEELRASPGSLSQVRLRKTLRVRNERLTEVLRELEGSGLIRNAGRMGGWSLSEAPGELASQDVPGHSEGGRRTGTE